MVMGADIKKKVESIKRASKLVKKGFERAALSDKEKQHYIKMVESVLSSLHTTDARAISAESVNSAIIALTFAQGLLKQHGEASVAKQSLMGKEIKLREAEEHAAKADKLARIDTLTEIPNRRGFEESARKMFSRFVRKNLDTFSVLFIDVKQFKTVNDTLGHLIGDDALVRIAEILENTAREEDLVARFAGDEFIIACPGQYPDTLRERIYRAFDNATLFVSPNRVDLEKCKGKPPRTIPLSVDVGLARATDHAESLDVIVKKADTDMYREKHKMRTRIPLASDLQPSDIAPD